MQNNELRKYFCLKRFITEEPFIVENHILMYFAKVHFYIEI